MLAFVSCVQKTFHNQFAYTSKCFSSKHVLVHEYNFTLNRHACSTGSDCLITTVPAHAHSYVHENWVYIFHAALYSFFVVLKSGSVSDLEKVVPHLMVVL